MARETNRVMNRRIHDVAPQDSWDRALLLIAFLAGVGGGILLKLSGAHPFWGAGFAALVLCVYAAATYYTTQLRIEPEAIGDNCYYLGFLFTLTSLAVTLYFVVQSGAEDRAQLIPEVISGFGVALSSTIAGVFLRVLMMQFRVDLVARERQTRTELDMASRDLREEMARSVRQIKSFTIEALQHASEREEAMRRTTAAMVTDIREQMGQTTAIVNDALREAAQAQTAAAVTAIRDSVTEAAQGLLHSAQAAETGLEADASAAHVARMRATERMTRSALAVEAACGRLAEQAATLGQALDRASGALDRDDRRA